MRSYHGPQGQGPSRTPKDLAHAARQDAEHAKKQAHQKQAFYETCCRHPYLLLALGGLCLSGALLMIYHQTKPSFSLSRAPNPTAAAKQARNSRIEREVALWSTDFSKTSSPSFFKKKSKSSSTPLSSPSLLSLIHCEESAQKIYAEHGFSFEDDQQKIVDMILNLQSTSQQRSCRIQGVNRSPHFKIEISTELPEGARGRYEFQAENTNTILIPLYLLHPEWHPLPAPGNTAISFGKRDLRDVLAHEYEHAHVVQENFATARIFPEKMYAEPSRQSLLNALPCYPPLTPGADLDCHAASRVFDEGMNKMTTMMQQLETPNPEKTPPPYAQERLKRYQQLAQDYEQFSNTVIIPDAILTQYAAELEVIETDEQDRTSRVLLKDPYVLKMEDRRQSLYIYHLLRHPEDPNFWIAEGTEYPEHDKLKAPIEEFKAFSSFSHAHRSQNHHVFFLAEADASAEQLMRDEQLRHFFFGEKIEDLHKERASEEYQRCLAASPDDLSNPLRK